MSGCSHSGSLHAPSTGTAPFVSWTRRAKEMTGKPARSPIEA
eukprot:CAMPEP_0177755956 /NCGR_PEP_ID=MMETSP0491_2-20121128/2851_1 /TAXON_ID=63592 /ORGANISM="Tetraselmis chuii, Strain PLY429" /LENGTH=41 /DNA_ID= /DNA_START= /DNA_END= /DNA_ORIENTATION=